MTTTKRGRRPPMTGAERSRRYRARRRHQRDRERQQKAWGEFAAGLPTLEEIARDHPDLIRVATEDDLLFG